ncbi:MAG: prepilin-type N-terminal cleavage/methylation domain-containing protein [Thermodesulfovibrionales bacterium]|nr:prepilin-type N-terminal cleavage/methylation domain-containing protein [Thermodesulfovibrionales bacterium]
MTFSNRGYTLLEVLVAIMIFSSMVVLATYALNQGLMQYQGLVEKGVNFWDNARHLWISRSIGSATDYFISDEHKKWFPYFEGYPDRISYVSISPLATDIPVVVWINKERQKGGKYSLIYYELPVYTKDLKDLQRDYRQDEFKKGHSITLLNDLEDVSFKYYGFDFIQQKERWVDTFIGEKFLILPYLVKVDYKQDSKEHSFFYRINTNSVIKLNYNER